MTLALIKRSFTHSTLSCSMGSREIDTFTRSALPGVDTEVFLVRQIAAVTQSETNEITDYKNQHGELTLVECDTPEDFDCKF